jgi:hypothetical protein
VIPTYAGWPVPALVLFSLAWLTILALLVAAAGRMLALWRAWRRGELPPLLAPGAGRPFAAIGQLFGLIAVLCFLAGALDQRYVR